MKVYYCAFHAIAANFNETMMEYTWSVVRRDYSTLMKEGQLIRDAIFKDESLYYRFGLSSLDGVIEVTFFITVIEGDVALLGSTEDPYPSFNSQASIKSSARNRITFTKD